MGVAPRARRGAHGVSRAAGAAFELFGIANGSGAAAICIRQALRAPPGRQASGSGSRAIGIYCTLHALTGCGAADRVGRGAVSRRLAPDALSGRLIANARVARTGLRASHRTRRMTLVIARPASRRAHAAIRVGSAGFTLSSDAELVAATALRVTRAIDAAERRIALARSTARRAKSAPRAANVRRAASTTRASQPETKDAYDHIRESSHAGRPSKIEPAGKYRRSVSPDCQFPRPTRHGGHRTCQSVQATSAHPWSSIRRRS